MDFAPFTWLTTVISLLLGAVLSFLAQLYLTGRARRSNADDRFRDAVAAYATAVRMLQQAELQRAVVRAPDGSAQREGAVRFDSDRLRGAAWSSYYVLRLSADGRRDASLLAKARKTIELCAQLAADGASEEDMRSRGDAVGKALDEIVDEAAKSLGG